MRWRGRRPTRSRGAVVRAAAVPKAEPAARERASAASDASGGSARPPGPRHRLSHARHRGPAPWLVSLGRCFVSALRSRGVEGRAVGTAADEGAAPEARSVLAPWSEPVARLGSSPRQALQALSRPRPQRAVPRRAPAAKQHMWRRQQSAVVRHRIAGRSAPLAARIGMRGTLTLTRSWGVNQAAVAQHVGSAVAAIASRVFCVWMNFALVAAMSTTIATLLPQAA